MFEAITMFRTSMTIWYDDDDDSDEDDHVAKSNPPPELTWHFSATEDPFRRRSIRV